MRFRTKPILSSNPEVVGDKFAEKAVGAVAIAASIFSLFTAAGVAEAGGLTLECARADFVNPQWNAPLTFSFEGEDHGLLKVGGVFGAFEIPATRAPLQIQPGQMGEAIDGVAKAHVKLPMLNDVEACIKAAASAAQGDAYGAARDSCLQKLSPTSSGVDAVAQIRIGLDGDSSSGEDAFVVFKLVYEGASNAPGGKMVAEAFPAQCKLKR